MNKLDSLKIDVDAKNLKVIQNNIDLSKYNPEDYNIDLYRMMWILLKRALDTRAKGGELENTLLSNVDKLSKIVTDIYRRYECDSIVKLMSDLEEEFEIFKCDKEVNLTKEQVKQIFDYGNMYGMRTCLNKEKEFIATGTFPENYDDALDYVYRLVVEGEKDPECLDCGRYHNKSCNGTINRGREEITQGNRCSGYYKYEEESQNE